jgi:hypothetical protein
MCNGHNNFRNLCCLIFFISNDTFLFLEHIFIKKVFGKELAENLFRSGSIRTFSKVGSGSCQKSSGSATLPVSGSVKVIPVVVIVNTVNKKHISLTLDGIIRKFLPVDVTGTGVR